MSSVARSCVWSRVAVSALCVISLVSVLITVSTSPADAETTDATGIATKPSNDGFWVTSPRGLVTPSGSAVFLGDLRLANLNRAITGMTSSPTGAGYWLVASDGGIFAFGDARFYGSTGSLRLNKPVVGMAATPSGNGYWLVASDGGIFAFGDAVFRGTAESSTSVFGMTTDGRGGYSLLRSDGAVVQHLAPAIPAFEAPPSTTTTSPVPSPPVTVTQPIPTPSTTTIPPTSTTTTTAPSSPSPSPPSNGSSNPFVARQLWNNPANPASAQANSWLSSRPGDAAYMGRLGASPSATWIGGWSGDIQATVGNIVNAAAQTTALPILVAYNIPGRDCGSYSAGGANGADAYKSWIRGVATGIADKPAVVILEPDALSQLDCLDSTGKQDRIALLGDAVDVLDTKPNTTVYLDAGHPGWQSASTMASRLSAANVSHTRGFSLNVSNFVATSDNVAYGTDISNQLGGAHFVVDTSRNGNGSNGEWCNPNGRALGAEPTADTGIARADAYLWVKRPGESDGSCNGGPNAGMWWAEYALGLAKSAWG